ncbi:MAG: AbrB/MazE/SpoVT family DNA-binding domain-containing protein [Bacteroidota bacterium]|nr:AbrB/MazE/SpoVT family DNA-binding domain-containing protein [Bacteroidota bacterium]
MKNSIIKATTGGRITIPVSIRKKLGIKAGSKFNVYEDEKLQRIILSPSIRGRVKKLAS